MIDATTDATREMLKMLKMAKVQRSQKYREASKLVSNCAYRLGKHFPLVEVLIVSRGRRLLLKALLLRHFATVQKMFAQARYSGSAL